MNKKNAIIKILLRDRLLPLYYHASEEVSADTLKALYEGGLRIVEYTNRGSAALKNFEKLKQLAVSSMPELYLGLGTVLDVATARSAIRSGADFLVSPGLVDEVKEEAAGQQILWIPGCMTPTEIIKAKNAGIQLIKLFPGTLLSTEFMHSIRELFPGMLFMPTGGVKPERENLNAWFHAGVAAVGIGSTLITKSILESGDYAKLTRLSAELLALIKTI
jgi:2-dehydro-3-deoxyphosphogluconate aldolase / (4S)-4-hydroxy-2-oxoglutarate aldolase